MKNLKRALGLMLSLMLVLAATAGLADDGSVKIGILQYVEHGALPAPTVLFKHALLERGFALVASD